MTASGDVNGAWDRIESWLKEHAPDLFAQLNPGASAPAIGECERAIGLPFPDDLRASYARHDGHEEVAGLIGGWDLMPLKHVMSEHKLMKGLRDKGTFKTAEADPHPYITKEWWSPTWIPIVSSGSGHSFCVDTAPPEGSKGNPGQVVLFFHDDLRRLRVAESLAAWLTAIARDLEGGKYPYDNGFSDEAFLTSSLEGQDTYK